MPNRAVLDSDILGALLRGQNPFDRICAPSCCCRAAVRGYSVARSSMAPAPPSPRG
eukprot:CAMPEP_0180214080 /NCGR_PEP_ID=MMETSP0987-20121128/14643_1 /TAXON_ID=697907 /ORGANISM="non described non described, Strain CCMP2293" /LENGTH=55 /DNA_ID=CAMNT_0022172391 /DNA_START=48 /DNA_END=211 /DNA_ORIENTATION=-